MPKELNLHSMTDRARKVIGLAADTAVQRGDCYISVEHLLVGLLREGSITSLDVLGKMATAIVAARDEAIKAATESLPAEVAPDLADAAQSWARGEMRDYPDPRILYAAATLGIVREYDPAYGVIAPYELALARELGIIQEKGSEDRDSTAHSV